MEEIEEWRPVVNYNGVYEISNLGILRSLDRDAAYSNTIRRYKGTIIKPSLGTYGYLICSICNNGISSTRQIHQLVAEAFLGHIPDGDMLVVDHINGDKLDNRAVNLRIVTTRENTSTCFRKNKGKYTSRYVGVNWHKGHEKWQSRITYSQKSYNLGFYDSELDASNSYQLALSHVINDSFYEYWETIKRVRKGYYWNRKNKTWDAAISTNGKSKFLGCFSIEQEASDAYQKALKEKKAQELLKQNTL